MINPARVLNFLDITGNWDPTLALVFAGALLVALPGYQWILKTWRAPVLGDEFDVPTSTGINPRLIGGSALFGIGWGLGGFCPGPGLTALVTLQPGVVAFVVAMFVGAASWKFGFGRG